MMSASYTPIGWKRWFAVNCSMMLYEWTGSEWLFTGTARRVSVRVRT